MATQERHAVQKAELHIDASPDAVYAVVSNVTRTGEWSPECQRCEWVEGATGPTFGARFRGYSRYGWLRWSKLNKVITAEPGKEFAFKVLPDWFNKGSSIWRYRMEPKDGGTLLSESTEVLEWPGLVVRTLTSLARRPDDMTNNIEQSLQRIKTIVEGGK